MATNKTIYLIRHGQTDYNLRGIVQGSGIDSDLNATGQSQAQAFYHTYKHINFEHVYTSELKRTIQSVDPFLKLGLNTSALPELNEINWGVFEGRQVTPESQKKFNEVIVSWKNGELNQPIEGGESPNDMYRRQKGGWDKIVEDPHQTVLVCMHGRAMRSFLSLIMETPLQDMDQYPHSNLCLYVIRKEGDLFELKTKNCTEHLMSIPS